MQTSFHLFIEIGVIRGNSWIQKLALQHLFVDSTRCEWLVPLFVSCAVINFTQKLKYICSEILIERVTRLNGEKLRITASPKLNLSHFHCALIVLH